MQLIQHVTVGAGGQASIVFNSIPTTFTDLVMVTSLRNSNAAAFTQYALRINGTTTGYIGRSLIGVDGSTGSGAQTGGDDAFFSNWAVANGATANTFGNEQYYFANYRSASPKSISHDSVTENNASTGYVSAIVAKLWNNNAAITSIQIDNLVNQWMQHSSASLYGITRGSTPGVTVS